ncbi:MAG: hydrogen peroxide-inducible genes activator [Azospirillaceae bacterium]
MDADPAETAGPTSTGDEPVTATPDGSALARHVTLRQLRYAVAVAEAGGFAKAAKVCHVAQPSLSAQVHALEGTLGATLFARGARGGTPTPAGERVVAHARRVLREVGALAAAARAEAPLEGAFRLGVIPTSGPYTLPRIMPALRRAYPRLALWLREDRTAALVDALVDGRIDAAILALPVDSPVACRLTVTPLYAEPFLLAAPRGHAFAAGAPPRPGDLAGAPLLLLEEGHCLRDQTLDVCRLAGVEGAVEGFGPAGAFAATSLETLREMVAGGLGVTLLPRLACATPHPDLVVRPFADPAPTRTMALVRPAGTARESDCAALAAFLEDNLPDGVAAAA